VLQRVPRPDTTGENWRDALRAAALRGFVLLREYPGLSAHIVQRPRRSRVKSSRSTA